MTKNNLSIKKAASRTVPVSPAKNDDIDYKAAADAIMTAKWDKGKLISEEVSSPKKKGKKTNL